MESLNGFMPPMKRLKKRRELYLKLESFFSAEVESTFSPCCKLLWTLVTTYGNNLYGIHTNGNLVCENTKSIHFLLRLWANINYGEARKPILFLKER